MVYVYEKMSLDNNDDDKFISRKPNIIQCTFHSETGELVAKGE